MLANKNFVPSHVKDAIQRYVEQKIPTGDFLRAVLENNLKEACFTADENSLDNLAHIVAYCYWEIPGPCWGSKDRVKEWLNPPEQEDTVVEG